MTAVLPDVEVLGALDFHDPVGCAHSQHGLDPQWHDGGPATHYVRTDHACPARPGRRRINVYPACAAWVSFVEAIQTQKWLCVHCGHVGDGKDVFSLLCPIDG